LYPPKNLRHHLEREQKEIRDYVVKVISSMHPDWLERNGACPRCWDYYKQLGATAITLSIEHHAPSPRI
jgi:hypothetical protein